MRKSKPGNSVYFEVGIWYDKKKGVIDITWRDYDGNSRKTNVSGDTKRQNGHPNLFRRLAQILRDNGAPAPPDEEPPTRSS